jgi:hypothetical protein
LRDFLVHGGPLRVRLTVYNVLGQTVTKLVEAHQQAGYYTVRFDASSLPTGVYIYRLEAGDFVSSKQMMLIK